MVQIHFATRQINVKIVVFGPESRGREAELARIHAALPAQEREELKTIKTEGDSTHFFKVAFPLHKVGGMNSVLHVYGLGDELRYDATLKLALQGADGIIFIADARPEALADNLHAIDRLAAALKDQGLLFSEMPVVLTRNHHEQADALSLEALKERLGLENAVTAAETRFSAPSLQAISQEVLKKLNREYGLHSAPARHATARPAAPAPPKKAAETHERSVTARAFRVMHPQRCYPLQVIVSRQQVAAAGDARIAEVRSEQALTIEVDDPKVRIRPILPGCLVTPSHIELDTTPRVAEATFWVTPVAEGKLEHAAVEVEYQGAVVERLALPLVVTRQTLAKLGGVFTLSSTTLGPILEAYGINVENEAAGLIPRLLAWATAEGRWVLALSFAALTVVLYLWKKERQGDPVRSALDFELEPEEAGDPMVARQKAAVLLTLKSGERRVVPLRERLVALRGRGLQGGRAAIRFRDKDGFFIEPEGELRVGRERIRSPERLPREAFLSLSRSGPPLWFFDERPDPSIDGAGMRRKLREALIEFRPEAEEPIRELFKAGADAPLRRTIARLLLRRHIHPEDWQRARARFELDIPAV